MPLQVEARALTLFWRTWDAGRPKARGMEGGNMRPGVASCPYWSCLCPSVITTQGLPQLNDEKQLPATQKVVCSALWWSITGTYSAHSIRTTCCDPVVLSYDNRYDFTWHQVVKTELPLSG